MEQVATQTEDRASSTSVDHIPGNDEFAELFRLLRDPQKFFHERFAAHGPVFKSRLVYPVVFMIGAEANQTIMVTERHSFSYEKGYGQLALALVFANSIMLMDGDEHKVTRAILTPAVGRLAVKESADHVRDIWTRRMETSCDGQSHDVYKMSEKTTFDVAANALVGLELGDETETYRPYFERLIDGTMAATQIRFPFGTLDRSLKARKTLVQRLRPRIEKARRDPPYGLIGQLAHFQDEQGNYLPVDEVISHVLMLFWAAYDTTASAASWVLHTLARRPDWQRRLRKESEEVLGDEPLRAENAHQLPQFTWFLRELERMYPSVLFFPRITTEDLQFRGYHIPKGTSAYYSPYMSHRDPGAFHNPNAFDPDRWDPSRSDRLANPSNLVGFGGGPRVCLGKAFAQLQLKIMINVIVRGFRLEPDATSRFTIQGLPIHHPNDSTVKVTRR